MNLFKLMALQFILSSKGMEVLGKVWGGIKTEVIRVMGHFIF